MCPKAEVRELKTTVLQTYRTLSHSTVPLQRRTVVRKGVEINRDVSISVARCRPKELCMLQLTELLQKDQFCAADQKYAVPFHVDETFNDSALFKFALDAGGGSTKAILNSVNVENPQGQEHVRVWGEFTGVKDTWENLRRAFFDEKSSIKSDFEDIMNRRVVAANLKMGTASQLVMVTNSSTSFEYGSPQARPPLDGVTSSHTAREESEFLTVDFNLISAVRVFYDSTFDGGDFRGLSFFDEDNKCIATSYFRNPIKSK